MSKRDGLWGESLAWHIPHLEAHAKRAKEKHPEGWDFSWGDGGVVEMHENLTFSRIISAEDEGNLSEPEVMGPYFSLCHPDVVLGLIARVRELEAALLRACHAGENMEFAYEDAHRHALQREIEKAGRLVGRKPGDSAPP